MTNLIVNFFKRVMVLPTPRFIAFVPKDGSKHIKFHLYKFHYSHKIQTRIISSFQVSLLTPSPQPPTAIATPSPTTQHDHHHHHLHHQLLSRTSSIIRHVLSVLSLLSVLSDTSSIIRVCKKKYHH